MTREELIKTDEYIIATIEAIVISRKSVKKMREELSGFFLDFRDELFDTFNKDRNNPNTKIG